MRNLSLSCAYVIPCPRCNITATTVDLDGYVWAASERLNADGDLEVELWKIHQVEFENEELDVSQPKPGAIFTSTASHTCPDDVSQIVSMDAVMDERLLVIITRGGDIATMSLEGDDQPFDVVGSVEDGIWSASWSPDYMQLALITGSGNLVLMASNFDVLSESPLHTEDFGEDAPINVGWGSKQTQFHGSLGKAAAQAPAQSSLKSVGSSPDDDTIPRISWRGDGAFFVVSALTPPPSSPDALRRRVLRVYSREGVLQSTSEPVAGLEHALSWRPSGNLIVGTQRFGSFKGAGQGREGRHDVVFFERNGLRHGEFGLREAARASPDGSHGQRTFGYKVREVCWSPASDVLATWIEGDEGDVVQLWSTGNYHWYLKQEISAPSDSGKSGRFTSIKWHPEVDLYLMLTVSTGLIVRMFKWETYASRTQPPIDSGSVAVVDGTSILLTPFRTQNVPPPMSSHKLSLSQPASARQSVPVHMSFSDCTDILAILWESGYAELRDLKTRLGPGRGKVMDPQTIWSGFIGQTNHMTPKSFREIAVLASSKVNQTEAALTRIAVIGNERSSSDFLCVFEVGAAGIKELFTTKLKGLAWRLVKSSDVVTCHHFGSVHQYDLSTSELAEIASAGKSCDLVERVDLQDPSSDIEGKRPLFIGLAPKIGNILTSATPGANSRVISRGVNSFVVTSDFVIYTTTSHKAYFLPIRSLLEDKELLEGEMRSVERGSRIVTAIPSNMTLVLQMPRGNLETISPRPMVLSVVRQDVDAGNWLKAFVTCRKHRIDLSILVDHNPTAFRERLSAFLDDVSDVEFINLFLTGLGNGSQPAEVIAELCDAIRAELERRDLVKYVNSILTAFLVKRPADHEAGLKVLLHLRDSEPSVVEDAVKYIIFLVDANTLFDVALGMYDFSLVLMIAQHAQKDPREYLPFLRELRALETYYQRYRIDDHLRRYQSALNNLKLAGPEHLDEALSYIEKHQLYDTALSIWRETDEYEAILALYGEWLYERRDFKQAAMVFVEAKKPAKAMIAYEKGLQWRELFDLAVQDKTSQEDLVEMGYRVAEDLGSKKRYAEASVVLLDYSKDVREAVIALVQGSHFSEARRLLSLHDSSDLLGEIIHPGTLEARSQITEDIGELHEQLQKQLQRVRELRTRKVEEPEVFYGMEDAGLHNVDVMTDVSQFTAFTRYTAAPSTVSRTSKRSSRSKRRMERKVGSGRKGTVDEEEYLLKSITKLAGRFTSIQDDAANLIPHLLQFTANHRAEAQSLQDEVGEFEAELKVALDEIWPKGPGEMNGEELQDSWAARMKKREEERETAIKQITKPALRTNDWGAKLLSVGRTDR